MMMKKLALILILGFASAANAADFFVNLSSGNDANAGTAAAPYLTIQKAIDGATGGDEINVAGSSTISQPYTWTNFGATTIDLHLIIKAWDISTETLELPDGTTRPAAVLGGGGATSHAFGSDTPKYVQFVGFKLENFTASAFALGTFNWIDQCEVDNCGSGQSHAISVSAYCEVSRTNIHDISGHGIYTASIMNQIHGCKIQNVTKFGLNINQHDTLCDSNIVINADDDAIVCSGDRCTFTNNTLVGNGGDGLWAVRIEGPAKELASIRGNIITGFSGTDSGGVFIEAGANARMLGNNGFHDNSTNYRIDGTLTRDLRGDDKIEPITPFADAANGDYSLHGSALSLGARVVGQNGSLGAIQHAAGGGGQPPTPPDCPDPPPAKFRILDDQGNPIAVDLETVTIEAQ